MSDTNLNTKEEDKDELVGEPENTGIFDDLEIDEDEKPDTKEQTKKTVENNDFVTISKSKFDLIKKLLNSSKEINDQLNNLIAGTEGSEKEAKISIAQIGSEAPPGVEISSGSVEGRIVEGVFDGEHMIGPDGKQYSVPANYASKSKLVEGDIMKLTITDAGTFVYKQIGPIDRNRIIGTLELTGGGSFSVNSEGKQWKVLTASVTYYKGQAGDEVVILIPKNGDSNWAAIDNIVKNAA